MRLLSSQPIDTLGFAANQNGLYIEEMDQKQVNVAIEVLAIGIKAISGVNLPVNKRFKDILYTEIHRFLCEHPKYKELTAEEVLLAFRINSTCEAGEKIEHYQAILNLDYLGAVLNKWIPIKRKIKVNVEMEIIKKNLFELEDMPGLSEDEIIQFSKDEWNRIQDCMFLESRAYEILLKRKILVLSNEQKKETILKARERIRTLSRGHSELYQYDGNPQVESIVAKKIALAEYFNGGPIADQERPRRTADEQEIFEKKQKNVYV